MLVFLEKNYFYPHTQQKNPTKHFIVSNLNSFLTKQKNNNIYTIYIESPDLQTYYIFLNQYKVQNIILYFSFG